MSRSPWINQFLGGISMDSTSSSYLSSAQGGAGQPFSLLGTICCLIANHLVQDWRQSESKKAANLL